FSLTYYRCCSFAASTLLWAYIRALVTTTGVTGVAALLLPLYLNSCNQAEFSLNYYRCCCFHFTLYPQPSCFWVTCHRCYSLAASTLLKAMQPSWFRLTYFRCYR
ncbi:MAG: hypothetical protein ACK55Z_22505, partial [bacterium]